MRDSPTRQAAVEAFRTAIQLDENQLQANAYLGQFYYENKDYKQAEPCLLRAAAADPKNAQVLMALANTLATTPLLRLIGYGGYESGKKG